MQSLQFPESLKASRYFFLFIFAAKNPGRVRIYLHAIPSSPREKQKEAPHAKAGKKKITTCFQTFREL